MPSSWHRDVSCDLLPQSSDAPWILDINRSSRGHLTSAAICHSKRSTPVRRRGHLTSMVICFSLPRCLPRDLLPSHMMPVWCHRRGHLTSTVICFSFPSRLPRDLLPGHTTRAVAVATRHRRQSTSPALAISLTICSLVRLYTGHDKSRVSDA